MLDTPAVGEVGRVAAVSGVVIRHRHVVVMGVAGNGKTTVGSSLARDLGRDFIEGDSFHSQANIDKMSAGRPLDDDDRRPWLRSLADEVSRLDDEGQPSVMACSALRRRYRDWLREGYPKLFFLHLEGSYDLILARMQHRNHFMPPNLLTSQFEALEPLGDDELGASIPIDAPPDHVVATAMAALRD